ncbi:MAG: hypothetical protein RL033_3541, partial [Pseudomonadota bacterium]
MGTLAQSSTFHGDVGSKRSERFVLPSGSAEVRGELSFLSSDPIVTAEPLRFGDIALFRPSARRSFGDQLELSLGTSLLAKQPGGGDEWLFQGGSLGARFEPWAGYAVALDLSAGPQLGGDGSVWSATPSLAAKWALDREARVLLSLGNSFTALDDDGHLRLRAWLDELLFGTEVQLGDQHGGGWVAVSYGVPLAQAGQVRLGAAATPLDNGVHIDLQVGGVLCVGRHDDWDLFVYHSWIDRG